MLYFIKNQAIVSIFAKYKVIIAQVKHLYPFRTEKLRLVTPMVLQIVGE